LEEDNDGSSMGKLLVIGGGEVGLGDAELEGEPLSDRGMYVYERVCVPVFSIY
jgi:hypothetical protein